MRCFRRAVPWTRASPWGRRPREGHTFRAEGRGEPDLLSILDECSDRVTRVVSVGFRARISVGARFADQSDFGCRRSIVRQPYSGTSLGAPPLRAPPGKTTQAFPSCILPHVLLSYMNYYNDAHVLLDEDVRLSRTVQRAGSVLRLPVPGGLHHQYSDLIWTGTAVEHG